jgi:uncharacterized phage-associated protein
MKAEEVAKYIIAHFDSHGDLITNKKLQKLLYYVEAWGLVHLGGIIDEEFEAWVYGPVIPNIYHKYSKYGYSPILNEDIKDYNPENYMSKFKKTENDDYFELIDTVLEQYGDMTAMQLELLSHSEKPWKDARFGLQLFERGDKAINKETMKTYYSSLIKK